MAGWAVSLEWAMSLPDPSCVQKNAAWYQKRFNELFCGLGGSQRSEGLGLLLVVLAKPMLCR